MKQKLIIITLMILILFTLGLGKTEQKKTQEEVVVKTFFLKNISPSEAAHALKPYIFDHSAYEAKKMLTVTLLKRNVQTFEDILQKIDIKKKTINIRIFTIIASHKDPDLGKIKNAELKKVVNELDKILNFKSYTLDGTSFISVKEGTHNNRLQLSSRFLPSSKRTIELDRVSLATNRSGKRVIESQLDTRFGLQTSISIEENGYVVAGVSSLDQKEDSIILVLNATILD